MNFSKDLPHQISLKPINWCRRWKMKQALSQRQQI